MRLPHNHSFLHGVVHDYIGSNNLVLEVCFNGQDNNLLLTSKESTPYQKYAFGLARIGPLGRIMNYFLLVLNIPKLFSLFHKKNIDVIYVRNDPIFAVLSYIYRFLFSRNSLLIIFQLSHLKEEQIIERLKKENASTLKQFAPNLSKLIRNFVLRHSDLNLFISQQMRDYIESENSFKKTVNQVYGLGMSEKWGDVKKAELGYEYCIYVGTLDKCRDMETLVRSYIHNYESCQNMIPLLIIGGDKNKDDKRKLELLVSSLCAETVVKFVPACDRLECYSYIKSARFAICSFPESEVNKTISPTKLFEYLFYGVPTLACFGNSVVEEIISESKCGVLVDFSFEELCGGLNKIMMISDSNEIRESGMRFIREKYSYKKFAASIESTIVGLINK